MNQPFKPGDIVRRNTWKETTHARVLNTRDNMIQFEMIGRATDPVCNWRPAEEFVMVRQHIKNQGKFKVGDRVRVPWDIQGTIIDRGRESASSDGWKYKISGHDNWFLADNMHHDNSPAPHFKVGDRVNPAGNHAYTNDDRRTSVGTIEEKKKDGTLRVHWDHLDGSVLGNVLDNCQPENLKHHKLQPLVVEPESRFKLGDLVQMIPGPRPYDHWGKIVAIDHTRDDKYEVDWYNVFTGCKTGSDTYAATWLRPWPTERIEPEKLFLDELVKDVPITPRDWREILRKHINRPAFHYNHAVIQYPEDLEGLPTTQEQPTMNPIKIETKTFANGADIAHLSDEHVVALIQASENQIKVLKELEHKPKRVEKLIADLETGIKQLVDALDARE